MRWTSTTNVDLSVSSSIVIQSTIIFLMWYIFRWFSRVLGLFLSFILLWRSLLGNGFACPQIQTDPIRLRNFVNYSDHSRFMKIKQVLLAKFQEDFLTYKESKITGTHRKQLIAINYFLCVIMGPITRRSNSFFF